MKEFLMEAAGYNKSADKKLLEIIAPLPDSVLNKEMGTYYKTIRGTAEHIVLSQIIWLKRFKTFFPYPRLEKSPLVSSAPDALSGGFSADGRKFISMMKETDELFEEFVREIDGRDLLKRVTYKAADGKELERTYWKTIFHVLNHGTHHRGEISAMLDMERVGNDYSGFMLYST